jgi:predicted ABC-type ATPase
MEHPSLYIISGCNGAGKTTASITVLPEVLQCNEFVNADEIAKIISPMDPHEARIEAGRMMIDKISH